MSTRTGTGEKDTHLAVFDTPSRATVLPLHRHRLASLFEKACLINDDDRIGGRKRLPDIPMEHISHFIAVPFGSVQQMLHGVWAGFSHNFSYLPSIFPFCWTH